MSQYSKTKTEPVGSVADPHHINSDPDPTVHLINVNPDPQYRTASRVLYSTTIPFAVR
jgi:hypothetical protein